MANGVVGVVVDATVGGIDVVAGGIVVIVDTPVFSAVPLRGASTQPLRPMIATVTSPKGKNCEHRTFPVLAECPIEGGCTLC
jgi:hypothetical protein